MPGFKKIAVSLPADTFRSLEKARGQLGKTRSEVVAAAIDAWLQGLDASEARRRYVEGYLRLPEDADATLVSTATADWSSWEPGAPSRAAEKRRSR
jgi:metal-responsive CopG/Arc/MetJ family transcriptional regulator